VNVICWKTKERETEGKSKNQYATMLRVWFGLTSCDNFAFACLW